MYTEVATKQVVVSGSGNDQFSQAVSMAGANAVFVEITCFAKGGGNVDVQLQVGNDLQNWENQGTAIACTSAGYFSGQVTAIAAQYVRLRYTQSTSGTGIVAAGINTASL